MIAKVYAQFETINSARDEHYSSPDWQSALEWHRREEIISQIWIVGGLVVIILVALFVLHVPNRAILDTDTALGLCGLAMSILGGVRFYQQKRIFTSRHFEAEEEIAAKLANRNLKGTV